MQKIKKIGRKIIPKGLLDSLHYPEAIICSKRHGTPANSMVIIGIVGSKGKTTTANLLWSCLNAAGYKVGQIGTANIRIGEHEELNKWHMTMPGAPLMQRILKRMQRANCKYVIMEVPSEAQTQWRHVGINFDILIFMNVEREIMAAHRNSMDVLHAHNKRVFTALEKNPIKTLNGKKIEKTIIANVDSRHAKNYLNFNVPNKLTFGIDSSGQYRATKITTDLSGTTFFVGKQKYHINLIGKINAINGVAAVVAALQLGIRPSQIQSGFDSLAVVPGRMEPIDEGQKFAVFVDYAHDPVSMQALMDTGEQLRGKNRKLIVLFGGQGGGRDQEKLPELGIIAGRHADYVVISDDDPYDEPPMEIINAIATGAVKSGKVVDKNLFLIQNRRDGIHKALELAKPGDIVFIACKGADQLMMLAHGKSIKWDDRNVTREELKKILN